MWNNEKDLYIRHPGAYKARYTPKGYKEVTWFLKQQWHHLLEKRIYTATFLCGNWNGSCSNSGGDHWWVCYRSKELNQWLLLLMRFIPIRSVIHQELESRLVVSLKSSLRARKAFMPPFCIITRSELAKLFMFTWRCMALPCSTEDTEPTSVSEATHLATIRQFHHGIGGQFWYSRIN